MAPKDGSAPKRRRISCSNAATFLADVGMQEQAKKHKELYEQLCRELKGKPVEVLVAVQAMLQGSVQQPKGASFPRGVKTLGGNFTCAVPLYAIKGALARMLNISETCVEAKNMASDDMRALFLYVVGAEDARVFH